VWQSLHSHKGCEVPRWLQYWFKEKTAGTPYIILLLFTVMYIYIYVIVYINCIFGGGKKKDPAA